MSDDNIIDFKSKRDQSIEKKRRGIERVVLNDMLGCYSVIDESGSHYPVELIDISHDGFLFQIPKKDNKPEYFDVDKEITLRFYFTKSSFITVIASIRHQQEHFEQSKDWIRMGCEFNKELPSFAAMEKFIEFIYKFAEYSQLDKGEPKIYFL